MRKLDEDVQLAKIELGKKITMLCVDFLKEVGDDNIEVEFTTMDKTLTTDSQGRRCYGKSFTVSIDSWEDEEEDDE